MNMFTLPFIKKHLFLMLSSLLPTVSGGFCLQLHVYCLQFQLDFASLLVEKQRGYIMHLFYYTETSNARIFSGNV